MPHSSIYTKREGSSSPMRSRKAALSSSSRSEEPRVFFEWQPQPLERPAHSSSRRDFDAARFFQELAMLLEGEVGVELDLGGQHLL